MSSAPTLGLTGVYAWCRLSAWTQSPKLCPSGRWLVSPCPSDALGSVIAFPSIMSCLLLKPSTQPAQNKSPSDCVSLPRGLQRQRS
jgi:hypothetical protein